MTTFEKNTVLACILAGGKSQRMGQDKAFVHINSVPMIEYVIRNLQAETDIIAINSNGDAKAFAPYGYPVFNDGDSQYNGPLSGVLSAMDFAKKTSKKIQYIMTVPVDCPVLPVDTIQRLYTHMDSKTAVVRAKTNDRHHPVIALWRLDLYDDLHQCIQDGIRKVDVFVEKYAYKNIDFPTVPYDVAININTIEDITLVEKIIK